MVNLTSVSIMIWIQQLTFNVTHFKHCSVAHTFFQREILYGATLGPHASWRHCVFVSIKSSYDNTIQFVSLLDFLQGVVWLGLLWHETTSD